jgi:undecaprenyl-diphosphatase
VISDIIEWVAQLTGPVLYVAVAGLAFGETAILFDLVVPGEVGMVIAGAAGAEAGLRLPLLVLAGAMGATVGDSVSYAIGRRWGFRLVHRWGITRTRLEPKLDAAQHYFARRGGSAVFLGRWVGALRAVVPLVAGAARMPYRRFLAWNVLASVGWATTVVCLGWYLGEPVARTVDRVGLVLSAVLVVALGAWAVRRRLRASASRVGDPGTNDVTSPRQPPVNETPSRSCDR